MQRIDDLDSLRRGAAVHVRGDHGFVPRLINIACAKGVSGYPGDGANRWPAVHRLDAAYLFRVAVESALPGTRLNGVAEEGIPVREIADVIGRHLELPVISIPVEEAPDTSDSWVPFVARDILVSSAKTREGMGWDGSRSSPASSPTSMRATTSIPRQPSPQRPGSELAPGPLPSAGAGPVVKEYWTARTGQDPKGALRLLVLYSALRPDHRFCAC